MSKQEQFQEETEHFKQCTTLQIRRLAREPSLGLYYATEHLRKRVLPVIVNQQEKLGLLKEAEENATIDVKYAIETLSIFPGATDNVERATRKLNSYLQTLNKGNE
eukprot:jgi/Galph1/3505/GphlegSOOS_G2136.1